MSARRIQIPGYSYHVISRGNNKISIFRQSSDYEVFLKLLFKAKSKFQIKIYHYALMTNHIHLHMEPTLPLTLAKTMEYALKSYAQFFNKKYERTGHVFERRYKNPLIQSEHYFWGCSRYIHLNPAKAKIVGKPQDYPWSSYGVLAYGHRSSFPLDRHELYLGLGNTRTSRQLAYRAIVENIRDDYKKRVESKSCIIGDRKFRANIRDILKKETESTKI